MERILYFILTCDIVKKPEEPPLIRDLCMWLLCANYVQTQVFWEIF